jgi:carnitine 3-dehydrogenase
VALVGGGVIGAGWAARFALNGIDVTLYDPDPQAPARVERVLAQAERAWRGLTLAPIARTGQVRFASSLVEAVKDAELVQESAPEREGLKRELLAAIDRAVAPEALIASSTSGLLPSRLQMDMRKPERFLVAHPFNPVYLLPLVELCGGKQTAAETVRRAEAFYASLGMHPLILRHEIDGFLADRLMEALWREALHLVNDGIATADELDRAIIYGCGLRWAFMGSFLTFRLGGGEGGMRHFMAQFGPALQLPWTRLAAPPLTQSLIDRLVEQSDAQAAGRSFDELERLRDDCLVGILQALKARRYGAGAVLAAYEERLYELTHPKVMADGDALNEPLRLHATRVAPEWLDYNGHMTESRYLQVFGDASDALLRYIGVDSAYHAQGFSYYTVETHLMHLREVGADAALHVTTQLLHADEKRLHLFHRLFRSEDEQLLATAEQMLLHVDTRQGRACSARADIITRAQRIAAAHAVLPRPEQAGRRVGERRKREDR